MIISSSDIKCTRVLSETLLGRGIAIIRCDTMYGFIGIAPDTGARIARIKQRPADKSFLMLIPDIRWIKRFSGFVIPTRVASFWPGPLTIIIPGNTEKTIAVRIPDNAFLLNILTAINEPLYSTSVNRAGEIPMSGINDIINEFEDDVDLIVDSGDCNNSIPSTIIDISSVPATIVRQGKIIIPFDILSNINE